jgi:hypothetical protein
MPAAMQSRRATGAQGRRGVVSGQCTKLPHGIQNGVYRIDRVKHKEYMHLEPMLESLDTLIHLVFEAKLLRAFLPYTGTKLEPEVEGLGRG